jgi:hypothetical protein
LSQDFLQFAKTKNKAVRFLEQPSSGAGDDSAKKSASLKAALYHRTA